MSDSKIEGLTKEPLSFAEDYLVHQGIDLRHISWTRLRGDGSDRVFFRISHPEGSVILVVQEHPHINDAGVSENDSFAYLCRHLKTKGVGTPEIYCQQEGRGFFILEDLGDVHLQHEALRIKESPGELEALYQKVLDLLPLIQIEGVRGLDPNRVHGAPYDKHFVLNRESGYFFRAFLKGYLHLDIPEDSLKEDFDRLADKVAQVENSFFLYRDFQSRNIMIKGKELRFLDFQDGHKGPLHYDLAALLLDPYVDLPDDLRQRLMEYYLRRLASFISIDKEKFLLEYPFVALHRSMQMLGAFAFLSTVKGKNHFRPYIPPAVSNLKRLLMLDCFIPYKGLRKVVEGL